MSRGSSGCENPPLPGRNDRGLKEFVVKYTSIRTEYPGLCAYDFENI